MNCILIRFVLFIALASCSQSSLMAKETFWKVYWYEDITGSNDADQAFTLYQGGKFNLLDKTFLNPGFTESYFWLAIVADSTSGYTGDTFIIRNPHINQLQWYELENQSPKLVALTGDHFPYNQRPIDYTFFSFTLGHDQLMYLMKIDKRYESLQIPFQFTHLNDLKKSDTSENLFYGIFLGAAFLLLALSLSLYFNTHDKLYLLYSLQLLFQTLWWISDSGIGFRYIWSDFDFFASRSRIVFTSLGLIFALEFILSFIRIDRSSPSFKLKGILQALALFVILLSLLPIDYTKFDKSIYQFTMIVAANWAIAIVLISFAIAKQLKTGVKEVKVLLLCYFPYILFGVIFLLDHFGVIIFSENTLRFGLPLSVSLTMMILLFGITITFNQYRVENISLMMKLNERTRQLTTKILEAQETERKDLGKTLHNEVATTLSVAQLNLSAIKNSLDSSQLETFEAVRSNLAELHDTIRNISHRLFSESLENYGLKSSLDGFFKTIKQSSNLNLEIVVEGFSKIENAPLNFKKAVYRIVLELINNILKHAHASHIFVQIIEVNEFITIFIEDNGKGFDSKKIHDGIGMQLLRTQTELYQGTLAIESEIEKGTAITLELLIPQDEKI